MQFSSKATIFYGANGSGKTNILEALSYLSSGRGLRRAGLTDVVNAQSLAADGSGDSSGFSIFSQIQTEFGAVKIGVGARPSLSNSAILPNLADDLSGTVKYSKEIRIDGESHKNSTILGDYVRAIWLTPSLDRLFTGPAAERRKFFDRFVTGFDPGHNARTSRFEKAMRERNKLLEKNILDDVWLSGIEGQMAEQAVAIAAARREVALHLSALLEAGSESAFPFARIAMQGDLEQLIGEKPAIEVEDIYLQKLKHNRPFDQQTGRTQFGPHKSDLLAWHGSKNIEAKKCSTGEQKALLIALLLAHAKLVDQVSGDAVLIMLLDEITAHLDASRRAALFEELGDLNAQLFMTGTDRSLFAAIDATSTMFEINDGAVVS
ncbi:MAG: DNA replication/repair protein RecF [Hyphomicrobiales bacterium]|nr:DNA replication/repair protein RecF [Hyphomicrobiales bacterium]